MKAIERADDKKQCSPRVVERPGRILAIDYGRKRMGLALSDELRLTAQPLSVLSRSNRQNDLRRLRELCRRHSVGKIIVGHPLLLTGAESEMTKEAARFAARLAKNLGLSVELVDERLTSWEARQARSVGGGSLRRGRPFDDAAAALILRDFLHNLQQNRDPASQVPAGEAC